MPTDLIRQVDAAEILGVSRQYINQLVNDKKLKTYTVAKLVSKKEIDKFMKIKELLLDSVKR